MLAVDLIQLLSQALFVAVFVLALRTAVQHPRPINIEIALLFGAAAFSVAVSWVFGALGTSQPRIAMDLAALCALAVPYLLLRLVDGFVGVPFVVLRLAELGLLGCVVARFIVPNPAPSWLSLLLVSYFALVLIYVTAAFAVAARASLGVHARRRGAVTIGCGLLAAAAIVAGVRAVVPSLVVPFSVLGGPLGLASGIAFYLGFTTPEWLLRSWRDPELMAFIEQVDELTERTDATSLLRELQAAVSMALGVRGAFVGLWNDRDDVLEYAASQLTRDVLADDPRLSLDGELLRTPPDALVAGQCFTFQRPMYSEDASEIDPEHPALYHALGVKALVVAPMTVGDERYGVLGAYTPRQRLFGEELLAQAQLLARHAAIMLRSRRLMERVASVRAEEEAALLKEGFLSAATHDLKTPLTAIKGIAQWAERRVRSEGPPDEAALADDLGRIQDAAGRMGNLIDEMLDISRLQMAHPLELSRTTVDLVDLASKVAARHQDMTSLHHLRVEGTDKLTGQWDGPRLERVIDNLVSNAVKFSPDGGDVVVSLSRDGSSITEWATIAVRDGGIGLHADDVDRIFGRFERGANAARQGIAGTGLGLAYVREVVTAHGGEVTVESRENAGAVFTVKLPMSSIGGSPESKEAPAADG